MHFNPVKKYQHLLVQNKVQVESPVAGRACSPAVVVLSCTAGHQGHHHDAHFHTQQDLPAALGHRSQFRWKHGLGDSEGSGQMVSRRRCLSRSPLSQLTGVVSHAVQSDLQGPVAQLFVRHLRGEDARGQRRSEAGGSSSVSPS